MKKRNAQMLQLNKKQVSNLKTSNLTGGTHGITDMTCNSVPRNEGGLGCHIK